MDMRAVLAAKYPLEEGEIYDIDRYFLTMWAYLVVNNMYFPTFLWYPGRY